MILPVSWSAISFANFLPIKPLVRVSQANFEAKSLFYNSLAPSKLDSDNAKLRILLSEKKFKSADSKVMIHSQEIDCEHLKTIDNLWSSSSNGKFGLRTQMKIFNQFDGWGDQTHYNLFADSVGWRVNKSPVKYDDLTFSLEALDGHLPFSINHRGGNYSLNSRDRAQCFNDE
jgi:hypothetical protein